MNNNQDLGWPLEAQAPFTQAIGDGIIAGIQAFASKNGLNTSPGTMHTNALGELTMRFTAEMQDDADAKVLYKRVYPFKNSFRAPWQETLIETSKILVAMWENKEDKNAIALARTVSYLECLKFLQDNKNEVLAEYHRIRGGDLIAEQPKSATR